MKLRWMLLIVIVLASAACSRGAETPQLGIPSPIPPKPEATQTPKPENPKTTPTPQPTPGLPEGAILLPTLARRGTQPPPNTPVPIFPEGALEATRIALPPATPDVAIYSAVYQSYERGAMIYVAEFREIWVLIETPGKRGGPYYRFADLFEDGDTEQIAGLEAPPELLQPHRGFGRIWREQPGLRAQLGWATNYELPFSMRGAYLTGGAFDPLGNFVAGAGLWMMTLPDNSLAYFNEATNTWGIASSE